MRYNFRWCDTMTSQWTLTSYDVNIIFWKNMFQSKFSTVVECDPKAHFSFAATRGWGRARLLSLVSTANPRVKSLMLIAKLSSWHRVPVSSLLSDPVEIWTHDLANRKWAIYHRVTIPIFKDQSWHKNW